MTLKSVSSQGKIIDMIIVFAVHKFYCVSLAAGRITAESSIESGVGGSDRQFIRMLKNGPCVRAVVASSSCSCVFCARSSSD